jgi:hypothetical protein
MAHRRAESRLQTAASVEHTEGSAAAAVLAANVWVAVAVAAIRVAVPVVQTPKASVAAVVEVL